MESNEANNESNQQEKELSQYRPVEDPNKNRLPIFIGVLVVLLAVAGFFFFQNQQLKESVQSTNKELANTVLQLDSVSSELDRKIIELTRLGQDVDTLMKIRDELDAEKTKLLTTNRANRNLILQLQNKVGGYTELLLLKDEEIKQLKAQNAVLLDENTTLKTEKNVLSDSIYSLAETTSELNQKVRVASQLGVSGMSIFAINDRGREREGEFKNRHIAKLKIEFFVDENKVAPIEGKSLLVRVIGPDNNVLFDVTRGSGSFSIDGRELFFTVKKDILYDRKKQKISLIYDKGSEYAVGRHQVEVYTDEYLMGQGSFVIK